MTAHEEPATPGQGTELCLSSVQPISTFSHSKMGTGFPARPTPWASQASRVCASQQQSGSFPAASTNQGSHLLPAASRTCLGSPCSRAGTAPAWPQQPPCSHPCLETCGHSVPFILSKNNGWKGRGPSSFGCWILSQPQLYSGKTKIKGPLPTCNRLLQKHYCYINDRDQLML